MLRPASRALLLGAALCALAPLAQGEGLSAEIKNENNRGKVEVQGSAAQFPDGTELRVEVVVKGNYPDPIVAALFRVRVQDGQFLQEETRPAVFAPLSYVVTLKLPVDAQAPQIRKLIEQKFGWPRNHVEKLDFVDVTLGTEEESAAFRLSVLRRLRTLNEELEQVVECLAPATERPVAENPAWKEQQAAFVGKARALGAKVRRFSREYAALPDQDLLETLSKSLHKLSDIAAHVEKGGDPVVAQRDLGYVRGWTTGIEADVTGRLPVEERER
ncbi:MAG: hypothetical protein R3F62_07790 [Planctomycetota bacterium]